MMRLHTSISFFGCDTLRLERARQFGDSGEAFGLTLVLVSADGERKDISVIAPGLKLPRVVVDESVAELVKIEAPRTSKAVTE